MKNAFDFTLKALFVLKLFKFLYWIFDHAEKLLELSKKVKAIATKGLTKNLINKISILHEAKCFSLGIFQNYLVFIPAKKYIKYFSGTTQIESWKSNEISEKKYWKCNLIRQQFFTNFCWSSFITRQKFWWTMFNK